MRIAVNTECLVKDGMNGTGRYAHELLRHIVLQHAEHEFLFLFDKPFDASFIYAKNVQAKVVSPSLKSSLGFRYGYDIKLAAAIKKCKANLFIGFDGIGCLTTKVPQILALSDLSFIKHPNFFSRKERWFYKLYQQKFIDKAQQIVVPNLFMQQDIIKQYQTLAEKISVVLPAAAQNFAPVNSTERQAIKEAYADGRECFLFVGGNHPRQNLMNVLKAFSIFKKWQQSNMKLLLVGKLDGTDLLEKLKTYKHRTDVIVLDAVAEEQFEKLLATCYALVYPPVFEGFGMPIIEGMQSGVPVITSSIANMQELGGEAALYAEPTGIDEIANHLKKLYKDENFRNQLIQKGFEQAAKFSWQSSADQFYKIMEASASK